jgi:hypothetical protein
MATLVIDRHALVIASVTLNGAPARVLGIRDDYATVVALRGESAPIQYSWERVDAVVRSGGNFSN